jgi:hypothetical protein
MDVIARTANGFGYRADDYGNGLSTAYSITPSSTGAFSRAGLIETHSDVDYFVFSTAGGTIQLNVDVREPYTNLDAKLELRSATGAVLATASPTTSFDAGITQTLAAGTYYVVVSGAGISSGAQSSNYGLNVGRYTLSGLIPPGDEVVVQPPRAPTGLVATAASTTQINLRWTDNATNETGYKIERLVNGTWTQVASVGANVASYSATGLMRANTYSFRVRSYNAGGNSGYSNTTSATTLSSIRSPKVIGSLMARVRTSTILRVQLTWTDTSSNESSFYIFRSSNGGRTWTRIAIVGANSTTYSDGRVGTGRAYMYKVMAVNSFGSATSTPVSVRIQRGTTAASLASRADLVDSLFASRAWD